MAAALSTSTALAGQPLETETARVAPRGTLTIETGVERQRSSDGSELDVPIALEYSLTDRLELLVEPVAYTNIRDRFRSLASGAGDLEVSLLGAFRPETRRAPALALALEVKAPTARRRLIGSGAPDYTGYAIFSKSMRGWDTHLNLAYAVIGHPAGVKTNNVGSFAVAAEHRIGRFDLVGEVLGSSAALAGGETAPGSGGESQNAPEIGGAELVGTIGGRVRLGQRAAASLGLSIDNNAAIQVHPGLTMRFR